MLIKLYDYRANIYNSKGMSTKTFVRPIRFLENEQKLGSIYINCTKRNIFCTLTDTLSKKVKSSCSLRVPNYKNEFNERENLYTRGLVLGKFFGSKVVSLGYNFVLIYSTLQQKDSLRPTFMGDRNDSETQKKSEMSVAKYLQTSHYGPQNTEISPYRICEFLWEGVFSSGRPTKIGN